VRDYVSIVKFREEPLGALGNAAAISCITTLTIVFLAFSQAPPEAGSGLNVDIPALLIGLPAFTAALLGHWSDPTRIPKSSVSAYLGLLGTMLISLLSATVYTLDANHRLDWTETTPGLCCGAREISTNWPWLALATAASTQTLYLLLRVTQWVRYLRNLRNQTNRRTSARTPDQR
jgi:hypothetical protein